MKEKMEVNPSEQCLELPQENTDLKGLCFFVHKMNAKERFIEVSSIALITGLILFILISSILEDIKSAQYILVNGGFGTIKKKYEEEKYKCENAGFHNKDCDIASNIKEMFE